MANFDSRSRAFDRNHETHSLAPGSIVIVGAGLSGLVAGCLLLRGGVSAPVVVIDSADQPGGLLSSFDGGEFGRFDHGMHTFTSANVPDLDDFMIGLMERDEWVVMAGKQRDISGVYYHGRLQHACHYPDLRNLPEPARSNCIADFCLNLGKTETSSETLEAFMTQRFGRQTGDLVFSPIMDKLYGINASELDPVVASTFPLDRLALYDEPDFVELMSLPRMRQRVAYPEQRNLDLQYASTRYSLYPKQFGSFRLIDALVKRLHEGGGKLLTGMKLDAMTMHGSLIDSLTFRQGESTLKLKSPRQVFWTAGYPALARTLGLDTNAMPFESRRRQAVVSLLLDKPVELGDLYYFWNWDADFKSYRVTNYCGYCPTAARAGGYPVGFEFVLDPRDGVDSASLRDLAVRELKAMNLYPEGAKVLFSIGDVLPVGFPTFSLENRRRLSRYQSHVQALGCANIAVTGIQAEWGIIYQPEVLAHAYKVVQAYLEGRNS